MDYPGCRHGTLRSCRHCWSVRLILANFFVKERPSILTIIADPSCIPATILERSQSTSLLRCVSIFELSLSWFTSNLQRGDGGGGVKSPRGLAALAALCGAVVLAGWVAAGLAGLGSPDTESTGALIDATRATS